MRDHRDLPLYEQIMLLALRDEEGTIESGSMSSVDAPLDADPERTLLDAAVRRFGLSERARHRVLKLARTIADLTAEQEIGAAHLSEAIGFRVLDRHGEDR